jgi:hypothetical protein
MEQTSVYQNEKVVGLAFHDIAQVSWAFIDSYTSVNIYSDVPVNMSADGCPNSRNGTENLKNDLSHR